LPDSVVDADAVSLVVGVTPPMVVWVIAVAAETVVVEGREVGREELLGVG
jgi:hypothetical protein